MPLINRVYISPHALSRCHERMGVRFTPEQLATFLTGRYAYTQTDRRNNTRATYYLYHGGMRWCLEYDHDGESFILVTAFWPHEDSREPN